MLKMRDGKKRFDLNGIGFENSESLKMVRQEEEENGQADRETDRQIDYKQRER